MTRYVFAAAVLLMTACGSSPGSSELEVRETLDAFIAAFERGDVEAMRSAFAEDAVTFPRAIMGGDFEDGIDPEDYRRVTGIDPQMLLLVERLKSQGGAAPFLDIEPRDVDIRVSGTMALVTFHLGSDQGLGRRTFVLEKRAGHWKILHLHASNVLWKD